MPASLPALTFDRLSPHNDVCALLRKQLNPHSPHATRSLRLERQRALLHPSLLLLHFHSVRHRGQSLRQYSNHIRLESIMSYRPSPPSSSQPQGQPQSLGRSSPMPPVPHVSSQNIGQPGSTSASSSSNNLSTSPGDKGPDYVYFERKPTQYSESTLGKAMAAKMKLELFYKEGVEGVVGRKER